MNLGEMIDAVLTQGGFDSRTAQASRSVIASWLNDRYRVAVAESMYQKQAVSLGATVADQADYLIPANIVDIHDLVVGGGAPYARASASDVFRARAYGGYVDGAPGAYVPGYNSLGQQIVTLFPTPTESGAEIQALAATSAVALSDETDVPAIPEEFHQGLVDGAIATGIARIYERLDDAQVWEARFSSVGGMGMVQKLKRRANSRVGSGPVRARLVG